MTALAWVVLVGNGVVAVVMLRFVVNKNWDRVSRNIAAEFAAISVASVMLAASVLGLW